MSLAIENAFVRHLCCSAASNISIARCSARAPGTKRSQSARWSNKAIALITIHFTESIGVTADAHARYLTVKGKRSRNNPRFGCSGWVVWHFTVDDREVVEHLLPTEQGDHADYGGQGDRESIGIEICEFPRSSAPGCRNRPDCAPRGCAGRSLSDPDIRNRPSQHWTRWDFPHGALPSHSARARSGSRRWMGNRSKVEPFRRASKVVSLRLKSLIRF